MDSGILRDCFTFQFNLTNCRWGRGSESRIVVAVMDKLTFSC